MDQQLPFTDEESLENNEFELKSYNLEIPKDFPNSSRTNSQFKSKEENPLAMDQNLDLIDADEEEFSDIDSEYSKEEIDSQQEIGNSNSEFPLLKPQQDTNLNDRLDLKTTVK